jgi:hypothetical protein
MMEEESLTVVRKLLPKEWVIHQYAPDYGIDFVVETFEFINTEQTIAETLGEFFFVQLKSVSSIEKSKLVAFSRMNVEKSLSINTDEKVEIDVIKYPLDADELHTVMHMGHSVPTVLLLVDLSTHNTYFICLNDYIEKIILAEPHKLANTSTITIYIPANNNIANSESVSHLAFLARRSKLFGAFNKFNYQRTELEYNSTSERVLHFISIIKQYDFWQAGPYWPALSGMYDKMLSIEKYLGGDGNSKRLFWEEYNSDFFSRWFDEAIEIQDDYSIEDRYDDLFFTMNIRPFWDKLCNLGNMYEEFCKEWFLPTYFWHELYLMQEGI